MVMRRNMKVAAMLLCALLSIVTPCARAQIDTATVAGRVVDRTGATVPMADVTVTNTGTNFGYHAKSAANGEWMVSPVHIGSVALAGLA